jgi:hypothetical protein
MIVRMPRPPDTHQFLRSSAGNPSICFRRRSNPGHPLALTAVRTNLLGIQSSGDDLC